MQDLIISIATNRSLTPETAEALRAIPCPKILTEGISDTALARNVQLTRAFTAKHPHDTVVLIDDDIAFNPEQLHRVVDLCRTLKAPTTALYIDKNGNPAMTYHPHSADRWLCGLGFLAVPRVVLHEVAEVSPEILVSGTPTRIFTWSGPGESPEDGKQIWMSEDYQLTMRLGGAVLAPIQVGHIKAMAIYPTEKTIAATTRPRHEKPKESPEPDPVLE